MKPASAKPGKHHSKLPELPRALAPVCVIHCPERHSWTKVDGEIDGAWAFHYTLSVFNLKVLW